MIVGVLISVMIAIVVGVNLIPMITETVDTITEEAVEPTAVTSLIGILPYIFVAVILIGAVAFIGFDRDGSRGEKEEKGGKFREFFGNAREVILRIEESSKNWNQYINNLDDLLGIKTVVAKDNGDVPGIGSLLGLYLSPARELWIDRYYDWYIADKHPDRDVFKVVGLHKRSASLNLVYLLGASSGTGEPFLVKVPAEKYLEASCKTCLNWSTVYGVTTGQGVSS